MIGSRLERIDKKLPDFDLKIKDLKEEEDKVARCELGKILVKRVVSIWAMGIACKGGRGGGGVNDCQDGLGHFFPTLPRGVRACQDGLGHLIFSRFPV